MVFVSGMTGIKPGTQDIIDGGVAVPTRQTLENIQTVSQAAGATLADVSECSVSAGRGRRRVLRSSVAR